jgi:hypothetical protein
MPVTWALFARKQDGWQFKGFTEHDEVACEFEEMASEDDEVQAVHVTCLEG